MIRMITSGPFDTNCYVLCCEQTHEGIVIDPAFDTNQLKTLIKDLSLTIKFILLTHGHFDHCGGLAPLKEALKDIPIAIHPDDLPLVATARQQAGLYGIRISDVPLPDTFIHEGDLFSFGKYTLKALHTPGHTPGGVCFYTDEYLFAGDTLFQRSIGRTDLPGGNFQQLISSIKNKLFTMHDFLTVYPGHGGGTTIGEEKQYNPYTG
ncbi:MBL fold metallo-hydrolase [bacterium]|nr:MBL fold metallo-hydrolase [bacterium]MCP5461567.1 MBL fold metallo-hydrolase [bacterium]